MLFTYVAEKKWACVLSVGPLFVLFFLQACFDSPDLLPHDEKMGLQQLSVNLGSPPIKGAP